MPKKILILLILAMFIVSSGFGCKLADTQTKAAMKPVTITYWRVFEGPDDFEEIITKYKALHPFITINYRKLRYDEYERELLNALAEDRGPDIFSIHNTWMRKYQTKLAPMPDQITMVYPVTQGTIKKEVVNQLRTERSITTQELRDKFVDVVSRDVILNDGKIYGLPLAVDTMILFYNKDLLNNAGISQVPTLWNSEFFKAVEKLTKLDPKKGIVQAGIALGGSKNISRYSDILAVIMMQNGATMMDGDVVTFSRVPEIAKDTNYNPGLGALQFYADFANPIKKSYSWNSELPNSLDMFISGNLAMMLGYSYDLTTIKEQAPKLNFSISSMPQIEGADGRAATNINFANYWVEVVSKKSANTDIAWDFIQFMTKEDQVKSYLNKTKKPTALRALVAKQQDDPEIGIFAKQVLTAKSWYRGVNPIAAEEAIAEMIDLATKSPSDQLIKILNNGASKVQQTIN